MVSDSGRSAVDCRESLSLIRDQKCPDFGSHHFCCHRRLGWNLNANPIGPIAPIYVDHFCTDHCLCRCGIKLCLNSTCGLTRPSSLNGMEMKWPKFGDALLMKSGIIMGHSIHLSIECVGVR